MNNNTYSKKIASLINAFLTEDDWRFSFDDNKGIFKFVLGMKGKLKKLNYLVDVKEDEFVVYAISPIGADEDDENMMARMSDFICRANYGLKNGNFEFDMRDGEIRYKCFADCDGVEPSSEVIKASIYCPAAMFDKYGEGIVEIIMSNVPAKSAIAKCEKPAIEELRDILGDEVSEDEDVQTMIMRLAARLGLDESDLADTTQAESITDNQDITTDLFTPKGGVA